jgi:hypothetical protein
MGFFNSLTNLVRSGGFSTHNADALNPKYKTFTDLSKDEQDALRLSVVEDYLKKQNNADYHTYLGDTFSRTYTDFIYGAVSTSKPIRLQNYRRMSDFPEVGDAIDEICDTAVNYDDNDTLVSLKLKADKVNQVQESEIQAEFDNYISLFELDENFYEYIRIFVIEGQMAWENIVDENDKDSGIIGVNFIPSESYDFLVDMKGEKKGICVSTQTNVYNRSNQGTGSINGGIQMQTVDDYMKQQEKKKSEGGNETVALKELDGVPMPWEQLTYMDSGMYNPNKLIVYPVLERARKAFRQLSLIEDTIIIYRLARAPVRLVFNVDTGDMNRTKAEQEVKTLMGQYQTKQFYNPETGSVSNDYNPHSICDNFWFCKPANGVGGTTVTTLDTGGQALWTELPDLEYFLKKLYRSLKVPFKRYKEAGVNVGRGPEISYEEYKFAKFVMRILNRMAGGFKYGFKQHLKLIGLWEQYELADTDFYIKFTSPTIFDLYEQQKLLEIKFKNYDTVTREHPEMSKKMAMKQCLGYSDKYIEENFKNVREESELMATVERNAETLKAGNNPYIKTNAE